MWVTVPAGVKERLLKVPGFMDVVVVEVNATVFEVGVKVPPTQRGTAAEFVHVADVPAPVMVRVSVAPVYVPSTSNFFVEMFPPGANVVLVGIFISLVVQVVVSTPEFAVKPRSVSVQPVPVSLSQAARSVFTILPVWKFCMRTWSLTTFRPVQSGVLVQEVPYLSTKVPCTPERVVSSQIVIMSPALGPLTEKLNAPVVTVELVV